VVAKKETPAATPCRVTARSSFRFRSNLVFLPFGWSLRGRRIASEAVSEIPRCFAARNDPHFVTASSSFRLRSSSTLLAQSLRTSSFRLVKQSLLPWENEPASLRSQCLHCVTARSYSRFRSSLFFKSWDCFGISGPSRRPKQLRSRNAFFAASRPEV